MDDRIRQGHDPQWRLAFQGRLDQAARARVRHAVRRGSGLADPNEAAVAVGLARRQQLLLRHVLIVLPLQVGLTLTWLVMLLPPARLPAAFRWLWAVVLTLLVGVAPLLLRHRYLVARRAADTNEQAARRAR
jgi:hypothetical protein